MNLMETFWIDSPLSLGTSRIYMTSVLSVTITLNKIRLIRFTLWVFYLRTSKMKGTGLSGVNGMRIRQKYYL